MVSGCHLQAVALAELGERARVGVHGAAEVDELVEEALEARRGDDLEDPRRLVAGVPEGVPLVARLEEQVARAGDDHLVAQQGADLALEHEAVLVLAQVAVQRRGQRARRHRVLDEREAALGLVAVDHEAHADHPQRAALAVGRPDDLHPVPLAFAPSAACRVPFIEQ
jgi:hypothetical protein